MLMIGIPYLIVCLRYEALCLRAEVEKRLLRPLQKAVLTALLSLSGKGGICVSSSDMPNNGAQ
jgi:hypothetical protein